MADKRSSLSNYPSKYSPGGWVTAAQFIIELICEAQAKIAKKDLPIKFWTFPEWEAEFKSQTRAVSKLLKKYESQAIITAIKTRNIWSLRPKWVEKIIIEEQKRIDSKRLLQQVETGDKPEDIKPSIKLPATRKSRNKMSQLLESDGDL